MSRWRRTLRWALTVVLVAGVGAGVRYSVGHAANLPPQFSEQIVFSGLNKPTNIEFAKDGRVFVAEKAGIIKVFPSVLSTTYTVFADLSTQVNSYWDRGLLGMALAPNFPTDPYVYVLYAYDAPPGQVAPVWHDTCSTIECPVTGRLSRLKASGNVMVGQEQVLVHDWCQHYQSHSIGDLKFDSNGALYASGGEGANFSTADYGNVGNTPNVCNDPPHSGALSPPTAEGGSLRSQDVRTAGDPTGLDGSVIRIDPTTGAAMPDNPLASSADLNSRRIVAYGFRNPYRFAIRPGSKKVFVGDVGSFRHEEIDRVAVGGVGSSVPNNGWPCYEGSAANPSFQTLNLNLCTSLYSGPGQAAPFFSWPHANAGPAACPRSGGSAITGVAFYPDGSSQAPEDKITYPSRYRSALFFADYVRNCISVMLADTPTSEPNPTKVESFDTGAAAPVDLAVGPLGELYYVDINGGTVRRYHYTGSGNHPPVAALTATATPDSLHATFDGSASTDQDPEDQGALTYTFDFGDGTKQGPSGTATASHDYASAGVYTASLTVTDTHGDFTTQSVVVAPGKSPPAPVIDTPTAGATWSVGQTISFTGHASDADAPGGGTLPASALRWSLRMQHCSSLDDCHTHYLSDWNGVSTGSFIAPDHEYPSYLELVLTARDADGLETTVVRRLDPQTVSITATSNLAGVPVSIGEASGVTPFTQTEIKGSTQTLSMPKTYVQGESVYMWRGWSDGGALAHTVVTGADTTVTATYSVTSAVNVALGATATADSACDGTQGPQNAVNGTVNQGTADRWCSTGSNKWLRVDLGKRQPIVGVVVYHAGAGGEDPSFNTRDFTIQVSDDGTTWSTLDSVTGNTANVTSHQTVTTTRFVRLAITAPNDGVSNEAHIYEVKVLALMPKVPSGAGSLDIAAGKAATADSQCTPDNGADKAVNGRWVGPWSAWCSAGAAPWLQVDLGGAAPIGSVVIRHAGAGGEPIARNTRDFTVQVSNDGTNWTTVATVTGNTANVTEHVVNTTARYVRIQIVTPTSGADSVARIYELEVYAQPT